MGYKYDRASFLEEAGRLVVEEGLSRLTFGRLAARLGVPDRVVVYYFPTKSDLISETMHTLGTGLQVLIEEAFGSTRRSPEDVVADAVRVLTAPESDRIVRVFLEIVGHAASGHEPYPAIAAGVVTAWVKWLEPLLADVDDPRAAALAVVARVDGLLIVHHLLRARRRAPQPPLTDRWMGGCLRRALTCSFTCSS
ncbi:MAG: TetR/AcrR family transcriptional regulator [Tetrasphaera sp.]|nr:TetR/AcrR family transcriptional regulator [Tetrasphaera sp.]